MLAQLLRCDYLPEVWQPDTETQHRRQLAGRRTGLVQQRTGVRNRIHSVLAIRLISAPSELFSKRGREWLEKLLDDEALDETARLLLRSDLGLHEALEQEIATIEDHLARLAWQEERVKLLITLPGVDVAVAWTLLAAIGDIRRFGSPEKLAGYLGLVPSTRQSAARCYHGPITKAGNSMARWMLIQAAQHAGRHPGPLGHFFNRLKRRKNHNIAVVATARKLAMIAWHMLTKNEPYRYAVPRRTEEKLARLRVRATGKKRRSGPAKGVKGQAKLPGGSRTIRSLDGVYENEELPPRREASQGERRHLRQTGTAGYAAQLATEQIVPRGARPQSASTTNISQTECEAAESAVHESTQEHSATAGRRKRSHSERQPRGSKTGGVR